MAEYARYPAETLQSGLRAMYAARWFSPRRLAANYGIYGPAFELMESAPREPGSEEYLDSEKYQLRHWSCSGPTACAADRAHEPHPAREQRAAIDDGLHFCPSTTTN
jgi:starch synthase (maltosyl-transferring)